MDWHSRIRMALSEAGQPPEEDVVEELAQHARAMYDSARAQGVDHGDADRRLTVQIDRWRAEAQALRRPARRPRAIEPPPAPPASWRAGLAQDLRYARRLLWRQRRFTAMVILTMAVGFGPATTLLAVTRGVLTRPLPWADADRVVTLKETRGGNAPRFGAFSNAAYYAWRGETHALEDLAAWSIRTVTLTGAGEPERIRTTVATASLFRVLGVRPIAGVLFDDRQETDQVVVISEGLWRQRFSGDPQVIGRSIRFDGEPYAILGVVPDAAGYPDRTSRAWLPLRVPPPAGNSLSMFEVIAKVRAGVSLDQVAAEGTARGRFTANTGPTTIAIFGNDGPVAVTARSLRDALTGDVRRPLLVLLVAVALLLVIAASNVASLQRARAASRRRELAIRAAVGAGTARILRQLVIERLILGLLGGAAGAGVAWALHRSLLAILPADFPRVNDLALDRQVLWLSVGLSLVASLLAGLVPARQGRHQDLSASLAERGDAASGTGRRFARDRSRLWTIGGQVAIASALLVAAGLFGRSFFELLGADRGFDAARILSAPIQMAGPGYSPARRILVLESILDQLQRVPDLRHVAFTSEAPLTPGGSTSSLTLPALDGGPPAIVQASPRLVSPGYFAALGLRVVAGRPLEEADSSASPSVVVVNETFARRFLGPSPLGTRVPMGVWGPASQGQAEIVGVVSDIRYVGASVASLPEMYFSYRQVPVGFRSSTATLLLRGDGDPARFPAEVRRAVTQADPGLVAGSILTLEDRLLSTSLARPRLYAALLGTFAAVAVLVTAVGLFGVLSYRVSQRSPELALRAALGARPRDLIALVLRQGIAVVLAGVATGLIASMWLMRFAAAVLYGVAARDPLTYVAVSAIMVTVAALACIVPARRVARLDPLQVMRS